MKKQYDYLIVGAGLFGATFAYFAKKHGKRCLVIDKRPTIGGNLYCERIANINVHKYGAHIFHTNNKRIWDFVNSIVPFNRYINCPVANYKGKLFNLPFNMNTFYQMWGAKTPIEAQAIIDKQRNEMVQFLKKQGVESPRNLEEQAILLVGKDIYETLIKGYTQKQWGRPCSELPAFIIRRLPVRMVFDNNYFNDVYQGIPIGGYNKLIEGLVNGADILLCEDFFKNKERWMDIADKVLFTGRIDEYYDFCYGKLEYRSVRFETEVIDQPNYQGNAVINYTAQEDPFTRIIEHKHFESFGNSIYDNPQTVISREYSAEWSEGMEPFYPVNNSVNNALYLRYKELADKETSILFGGRLAEYKYYDMAPIIERVMGLF